MGEKLPEITEKEYLYQHMINFNESMTEAPLQLVLNFLVIREFGLESDIQILRDYA